jgi:hypothetical protein
LAAISLAGCGGGGSTQAAPPPKTTPTITWAPPTAITYGTALSGTQLDATASVAGSFVYNPLAGTVPTAGTQTLSVAFTPTDTTDYNNVSASVKLTVNQATPTVTWPTPAAITYGTALSSTQLDATASAAGSFVYTLTGNVPALGAVPAVGTDTIYATFTPTDATDYASVTANVKIIVNPATPQITGFTPRYTTCDMQCNFVNYAITGLGFENGDIVHDPSGLFPNDITLVLASGATNFGITYQWQFPGSFQPWFETIEMKHPGGPYGNQASIAFLGSASQSTLVVSPTTGTLFQDEQQNGQIHWQKTDGTTGILFPNLTAGGASLTQIVVDDVTGDVVDLFTTPNNVSPAAVGVFGESGGYALCSVNATGMSFVSSIAAKGGYMVFTDPVENLVGIAKMDCTGYFTVSVAGQPWSVVMTNNGTETDAYVLSRDASANGIPRLTKLIVPSGTVEGFVDLTGIPTVTSIRSTTPYEGVYQAQAFSLSPVAAVLFMSGPTDGKVLTINTNTSNGAKMSVAYTTPVTDLPIGITAQESASSSTLWVSYIAANTMDAVTHIGAIDPTTGNYTPAIGAFPAGILAGGVVGTTNGVYGAMGSTITAPLVLQP